MELIVVFYIELVKFLCKDLWIKYYYEIFMIESNCFVVEIYLVCLFYKLGWWS